MMIHKEKCQWAGVRYAWRTPLQWVGAGGVGEAPLKGEMLDMVVMGAVKGILLSIHGEMSIK